MEGKVKRLGRTGDKFGIIEAVDKNTYYFKSQSLVSITFDELQENDSVTFEPFKNANGNLCATNVSRNIIMQKVSSISDSVVKAGNTNKEIIIKASENVQNALFAAFEQFVDNAFWYTLKKNDSIRDKKILDQFDSLGAIDIQAYQKLLIFDNDFFKKYKEHFSITYEEEYDYKNACDKAIKCRNFYSHSGADLAKFDDKYLKEQLENYEKLLRPLKNHNMTKPYYDIYNQYKDKHLIYSTTKKYQIKKLIEDEFPDKLKEQIISACGSCDITICEENTCIQTADYNAVIYQLQEYFEKQQPKRQPVLMQKLPNPFNQFIGRENELKRISELFQSGKHLVALKGIGGIGKTQTALIYAHNNRNEYERIHYVFFENSFKSIVSKMEFEGINESGLNEDDITNVKLEALKKQSEKTLLIIDNLDVDRNKLPELEELALCKIKILITTRQDDDYEDEISVEIDGLSNDDQLKLFKQYYSKSMFTETDDEIIQKILNAVGGHTLTIELLAKQMHSGDIEPSEMLEKLNKHGVNVKISDRVKYTKDNHHFQESMFEGIKTIFNISTLSEEQKYVMQHMSLIPLTGIERVRMKKLLGLNNNDLINGLHDKSWIILEGPSDNIRIRLHPVISSVAYDVTRPDYTKCRAFISSLITEISETKDRKVRFELCEILYYAISLFEITEYSAIETLYTAGGHLMKMGLYIKAYEVYKKAADIILQNDKTDSDRISKAKIFHELANACTKTGRYDEAIKNYNDAMVIREQELGTDSLETAHTYSAIAFWNRKKAEYEIAADYYDKAIRIYEAKLDSNDIQLADIYNDYGVMLLNSNKIKEAKKLYEKAFTIRKNHPDKTKLAFSYNNLGTVYRKEKEYLKAIEYHKQALSIRQEILDEEHPDLANSYNNIGVDYEESGEYDEAYKNHEIALRIRQQRLGKNHPDIAWTYKGIAAVYRGKGNYEDAIDLLMKALDIRNKTVGKHPYTAEVIFDFAKVYYLQGEYDLARSKAAEALNIFKGKWSKEKETDIAEIEEFITKLP